MLQKIAAILLWFPILVWVGAEALVRLFVDRSASSFNLKPGVTFSTLQAEALGLDWEETYRALLDDLHARRIRIPVYWTEIEPEENKFNFSKFDFLLNEAERRGARVIIAVGQKLPRWPECHIPGWIKDEINSYDKERFEAALFNYIRTVVERYKDSLYIEAWQVENEPFFVFGECPKISYDLVKREVELIKTLDNRPVIITDSGELGTWFGAATLADIVGTTMYRTTWKKGFGYLHYFLPPGFYAKKAAIIDWIFSKPVWVMEMQLEPWVPSPPLSKTALQEQMKSMDFDRFRKNIDFARSSHLSPIYFWGAEWWYWMKKNGHPEFWDYIYNNVFSKNE